MEMMTPLNLFYGELMSEQYINLEKISPVEKKSDNEKDFTLRKLIVKRSRKSESGHISPSENKYEKDLTFIKMKMRKVLPS